MMTETLQTILTDLMSGFDNNALQAHFRTTTIGFITLPEQTSEQYAIELTNDSAQLLTNIQTADLVLQATLEQFLDGLSATNTEKLLQEAHIVGLGAPGNESILERFLVAFGLPVPQRYPQSDKSYFTMPLRSPAGENLFRLQVPMVQPLPEYDADRLPHLIADEHPDWVAMYDTAWQLAFENLLQPKSQAGFVSNYIDAAFNENIFMWDSCFMTMFGHYGRKLFRFIGTLDNFYAKQHADGFICREINGQNGQDMFTPFDPRSTGPNIFAWAEWLDFQSTGDLDRLHAVFPVLVAYHYWWRDWRRWPDGSYWTSNLGSGMDNQTRVTSRDWHHENHTWVDATMQQALNCQILMKIGETIGQSRFNSDLEAEYAHLRTFVNDRMWDEASGFYYDVAQGGPLSNVKSIGAYWGLLAGIIPPDRAKRMVEHLEDPEVFNRFHRVPSQSADNPGYVSNGRYWRGGVWSPTNYMLLRGLTLYDEHSLAYDIARNHVDNVVKVFTETGTLWENYAPEFAAPGFPCKSDFVGWTGISAINIPIEYMIGLRPDQEGLVWDIRLTERHGVISYPIGMGQTGDFVCDARSNPNETPQCHVRIPCRLQLSIWWLDRQYTWSLEAGDHWLVFPDGSDPHKD